MPEKIAALVEGINRFHPLVDGYKSLSWVCTVVFALPNGLTLSAPQKEIDMVIRAIADESMDLFAGAVDQRAPEVAPWIRYRGCHKEAVRIPTSTSTLNIMPGFVPSPNHWYSFLTGAKGPLPASWQQITSINAVQPGDYFLFTSSPLLPIHRQAIRSDRRPRPRALRGISSGTPRSRLDCLCNSQMAPTPCECSTQLGQRTPPSEGTGLSTPGTPTPPTSTFLS